MGITIGGGGGGGWYGGFCSTNDSGGGGGGSGWVWTEASFNAWKNTAESKSGNWKLTSTHYLTLAETKAGNTSFPSPTGGTETGHAGNGYARISPVTE